MRRSGQRAELGFTLAELVIAILVIGILAVVAVPRLAGISDFEVQGTFDRALATVRYAQKVAVASRVPVLVSFSGNAVSACYSSGGNCTSQVTDPMRNAELRAEGSADVAISGTSFVFDGLGRPSTGPVTVTVTGGGLGRTFVVEAETGHAHP